MEPLPEQNQCTDVASQTLEHRKKLADLLGIWSREEFLWDQEVRESRAREEGRLEGSIETAKRFLKAGMDIEEVCRITGLSKDDRR